MDVHFDAALTQINLGKYDRAVYNLETAIKAETDGGNAENAIKCTCVLAELLSQIGKEDRAYEEYNKVLSYCNMTNTLPEQRKLAADYIEIYKLSHGSGKKTAPSGGDSSVVMGDKFLQ